MPHTSEPTTPVLHAVRLLGFADSGRVAARFQLDRATVESALEDFRASGWVTRSEFDGTTGWSLTEAGRLQHEHRLAEELDAIVGGRAAVAAAHQAFVPLNAQIQDAITKWQLRPIGGNRMAANDHTDFRWDDRVLRTLQSVGRRLASIEQELTEQLSRFEGYSKRYDAATSRALTGHQWVDGVGIDSCHVVWMELHEDLLGTLGLQRGHGN